MQWSKNCSFFNQGRTAWKKRDDFFFTSSSSSHANTTIKELLGRLFVVIFFFCSRSKNDWRTPLLSSLAALYLKGLCRATTRVRVVVSRSRSRALKSPTNRYYLVITIGWNYAPKKRMRGVPNWRNYFDIKEIFQKNFRMELLVENSNFEKLWILNFFCQIAENIFSPLVRCWDIL